jgi:hypothetical protein
MWYLLERIIYGPGDAHTRALAEGGDRKARKRIDSDRALRSTVWMVVIGCLLIFLYTAAASSTKWPSLAVGLLSAGAAVVSGGLVGFLFGIPHVKSATVDGKTSGGSRSEDASAAINDDRYSPSTSLEQIADWLTKIIVGVGLIDFHRLTVKLEILAAAIQSAMNVTGSGYAFGLSLILYFGICGFTFAFLWSRLYLPDWFREADAVKELRAEVSDLAKQQRLHDDTIAFILRAIASDSTKAVSDQDIQKAVAAASGATREQILLEVHNASAKWRDRTQPPNLKAIIAILKALISADPDGLRFEYWGELSYALSRKRPPELKAAMNAISEAIRFRNQGGHKGWLYYELRRARYRIELDVNKYKSDSATREAILTDLQAARKDKDKWPQWINDPEVKKWLEENNLAADLQPKPPSP